MRILQLSDLHIGKRLQDFNLIEDQRYVLSQALEILREKADAIFLCGDIYDNTVPSAEATALFDWFLAELHKIGKEVFIISGNHDSADKLHYGSRIFEEEGIHIVTKVSDSIKPYHLGDCDIYLLPFVRPADVRYTFEEPNIDSYTSAVNYVISKMPLDKSKCNIILAHQTVLGSDGTAPSVAGSETVGIKDGIMVGDVQAISVDCFKDFDYVALGHIHKSQKIGTNARYAGSIFKYHKDEAGTQKNFLLLETEGKNVNVTPLPIHFLHDVVRLEGTLDEILAMNGLESAYVDAVLKDQDYVNDPLTKLRNKYPNVAWIEYAQHTSSTKQDSTSHIDVKSYTPEELFVMFYHEQTGMDLNEEQLKMVREALGTEEEK